MPSKNSSPLTILMVALPCAQAGLIKQVRTINQETGFDDFPPHIVSRRPCRRGDLVGAGPGPRGSGLPHGAGLEACLAAWSRESAEGRSRQRQLSQPDRSWRPSRSDNPQGREGLLHDLLVVRILSRPDYLAQPRPGEL